VADINKFLLTLTPTQRAKNELQLTGRIDMSNTNYTQGQLKLTAEAMDVTSYYDLFAKDSGAKASKKGAAKGGTSEPQTPGSVAATATPAGQPDKEPDPVNLHVKNFTLE